MSREVKSTRSKSAGSLVAGGKSSKSALIASVLESEDRVQCFGKGFHDGRIKLTEAQIESILCLLDLGQMKELTRVLDQDVKKKHLRDDMKMAKDAKRAERAKRAESGEGDDEVEESSDGESEPDDAEDLDETVDADEAEGDEEGDDDYDDDGFVIKDE